MFHQKKDSKKSTQLNQFNVSCQEVVYLHTVRNKKQVKHLHLKLEIKNAKIHYKKQYKYTSNLIITHYSFNTIIKFTGEKKRGYMPFSLYMN